MTLSKSVSKVMANFFCFNTRRKPCGTWNRSSNGMIARGSGENHPMSPRVFTAIGNMPRRYASSSNSGSSMPSSYHSPTDRRPQNSFHKWARFAKMPVAWHVYLTHVTRRQMADRRARRVERRGRAVVLAGRDDLAGTAGVHDRVLPRPGGGRAGGR